MSRRIATEASKIFTLKCHSGRLESLHKLGISWASPVYRRGGSGIVCCGGIGKSPIFGSCVGDQMRLDCGSAVSLNHFTCPSTYAKLLPF